MNHELEEEEAAKTSAQLALARRLSRSDTLPLLIDALPHPVAIKGLRAWRREQYPDVPIHELADPDANGRA